MKAISLTVNGHRTSAAVEPRRHLADFLREHCLLTGTHLGCEHGVCGACTVLLDGQPVRSCITLAVAADGGSVQTIEGLEDDPIMVQLRAAFTREHALQCGYCTPGMLVTARDIVLRLPAADAARIRLELSGNLCRCTGYTGIVRAIDSVLQAPETADAAVPRAALPSRPQLSRLGSDASASPLLTTPAGTTRQGAATTLRQTVRLALRRAEVWAAIKDPAVIVACVPGAELTPSDARGRVAGTMTVALGPVRAHFAGAVDVSYDDDAWSGSFTGHGQDRATGTRLQLDARFRVGEEGSTASVVELSVDYGLRGPLAQFSRSGIVELVATEVVQQAARNLEARLSGGGAAALPAPLGLGRILLKVLSARLAALVGRVRAQWRGGR